MKRRILTVLLGFALIAGPLAFGAETDNLSNFLPESETTGVMTDAPTAEPAWLDLSLLGVITLGIIGLFWIRRHTSQL